MCPIAFIGTGFTSAPASAELRARPDFVVGAKTFAVSGVLFLFTRFREEAVFCEADEPVSHDEVDFSLSD